MPLDPTIDKLLGLAISKKARGKELSQAEEVILREYVHQLRALVDALELQMAHRELSADEQVRYDELTARIRRYS